MAKFKLFGQGGFFSKIGKRNLVIIGAVLLVLVLCINLLAKLAQKKLKRKDA